MIINIIFFIIFILIIFTISIYGSLLIKSLIRTRNFDKSLSILFLTDFKQNVINSTFKWGQALYYTFILAYFLINNYKNIDFKIYIKALSSEKSISSLKDFIHDNRIN